MRTILGMVLLLAAGSVHGQGSLDKVKVEAVSKAGIREFSPTISADGRTMIFEAQKGSKKEDKWELYQSTLGEDNKWSEPVPLTSINEKCQFIAGPHLNYEGNILYYTAFIEGVTKTEDIYYSELEGQRWSEPKPLGAPVNTPDMYEGFPSVSADGQSLYFMRSDPNFTVDRKSKEPCFTIFVSQRLRNGTWGEPKELPLPVNTGCERDPRIMADNHTLIFSSIREEGQGKYDLFQTRRLANGRWLEPEPLDFVNTPENDLSPCIPASGDIMYYFSGDDIHQLKIPAQFRQFINITLLGHLTAGPDKKPVKGVVTVRNLKTGESHFTQSNEYDGRYMIVMSAGQSYEVMFTNAAYRPETLTFDLTGEKAYREERRDINLSSAWTLPIVVQDKDLKKDVKARVVITRDDGQVIFSDSVGTQTEVGLETDHEYTLTASAVNYVDFKQNLKFIRQTHQEGVAHLVALDHEVVPVAADVTVGVNGPRKRTRVTYKNEDTGEVIVADAGEIVNLRKGDRYQVMTSSDKGFSYAMQTLVAGAAVPDGNSSESPGVANRTRNVVSIALPVLELKQGTKLSLNHIYFETNSSKLNESSTTELEHIVGLLKANPNVTIEVSAHTDDVGSDAYNNNLSQQRAQSVANFLIQRGVPQAQMVPVGYGKARPIVPNDSPENRARNRRVEMLVLTEG